MHADSILLPAAVKQLRDALERWPRNVRMLTSAAVLEGRRRNLHAARALFSKAHLLEPDNAVLLRVRCTTSAFMHACEGWHVWLGRARSAGPPAATPLTAAVGCHTCGVLCGTCKEEPQQLAPARCISVGLRACTLWHCMQGMTMHTA